LKAESLVHPFGNGLAVGKQAESKAIAAHSRIARNASDFLYRSCGRSKVRVAGSEVDNINTALQQLLFPKRDVRERIWRQADELLSG
jgi:hypothetical protein